MSFTFEMSNVKNSLTKLCFYIAGITGEYVWKRDPVISDSSIATRLRLPHPHTTAKDILAKTDPFSIMEINLAKPYAPHVSLELAYISKKATDRFCALLHDRNSGIRDEYFAMLRKLDGFEVKLQVRTIFKNNSFVKSDDIAAVPSSSVTLDDINHNYNKVVEACSISEIQEEGRVVKYRGPCVSICRDFSIDELAQENSVFDEAVILLHEFMIIEPKIISEKTTVAKPRVEKPPRERKKSTPKKSYHTVLSNRADTQFYSLLTRAEFERVPENLGVMVWNCENGEEKKYIRAALKLVSEL